MEAEGERLIFRVQRGGAEREAETEVAPGAGTGHALCTLCAPIGTRVHKAYPRAHIMHWIFFFSFLDTTHTPARTFFLKKKERRFGRERG